MKLIQQGQILLRYKHIVCLLIVIILCNNSPAQNNAESNLLNKNSTYLEIGGNGLWYSFNYDRILRRKDRTALSARVGFAYFGNFSDTSTITAPLTISFLYGKNKNFLELGGGPTTLYSFSEKITGIAAIGIIGFRHQPIKSKGLMYRIAFNPFIVEYSSDTGDWNSVIIPWGGISFGFVF